MVNWRKLSKIDAHIHLLPNSVLDANPQCDDPYMMSMEFTVEAVHNNMIDMVSRRQENIRRDNALRMAGLNE